MTSDKAEQSKARELLDYALNTKRVSLGKLRPNEFDKLLSDTLRQVDLRELRGFKPLKEALSRRSDDMGLLGTSNLAVMPGTVFRQSDSSGLFLDSSHTTFTPATHVVSVSRAYYVHKTVYRRQESGEETTNLKVALAWGNRNGYIQRSDESILVLRRPNDHSTAVENLYHVMYKSEKIPHENRMQILNVEMRRVTVETFRTYFKKKYAWVAQYLIWELASHSRRTLEDLQYQVSRYQQQADAMKKLGEAIFE